MTVGWSDVQNAIKAGVASLGAVATGAVAWQDEQRPTAKVILLLNFVYLDATQDRQTITEGDPGEFTWALSTLFYIRVQMRAESIANGPGVDGLFAIEKVRAGLRRPDLVWGAGIALQPDDQTYVHHVSYESDSRMISSYSFETGFVAVLDYPLTGTVDPGPPMTEVIYEGAVDVGETDPVAIDGDVVRP